MEEAEFVEQGSSAAAPRAFWAGRFCAVGPSWAGQGPRSGLALASVHSIDASSTARLLPSPWWQPKLSWLCQMYPEGTLPLLESQGCRMSWDCFGGGGGCPTLTVSSSELGPAPSFSWWEHPRRGWSETWGIPNREHGLPSARTSKWRKMSLRK